MSSTPESRFDLSPGKKALLVQCLMSERVAGPEDPKSPGRSESGAARVSYAQQRLWFLDRLVPGNPFYNVDATVPIRAPLNAWLLERTINEIVRRHETLRTTFDEQDGRPIQRIVPSLFVPQPVIDLRRLASAERQAEARRLRVEEARSPFDLVCGPLIRARLITLADDDYLLLLTLHHIISDGWSLGVFSNEMSEFYSALASGRKPSV